MDISKLRIFVNVVETQNFTRTAHALNLTQPSVSYIIKAIEDEIGQQLFIRNKRNVVPTKKGMIFYNQIKPLINKYYVALQSIQDDEKEKASVINIGCMVTPYNIEVLPRWIRKFNLTYPKVRFNVTILDHNKLKQYLESENIDVFLTSKGDAKDLKHTKFYPLTEGKFFAIVPNNNPLAGKQELALNDFSEQNMIFVDNNWTGVEMIDLQSKLINANTNMHVTYTNNRMSASILAGALQGITMGLDFVYKKQSEEVVHIPLKADLGVTYGAVIKKGNNRQVVKKFIQSIQKDLQKNETILNY